MFSLAPEQEVQVLVVNPVEPHLLVAVQKNYKIINQLVCKLISTLEKHSSNSWFQENKN